MKILIKSGRVIDPSQKINEILDVLIEDGVIKKLNKNIKENNVEIYDAKGKIICSGFVDLHVHFREPGQTAKETIETGSKSAAKGGFTTVVCMPNTEPVIDNAPLVNFVLDRAKKYSSINIYVSASMTKEAKGDEISNFGALKEAGCLALSDDGNPVMNSDVMRRAMEYAKTFDLPLLTHCEDKNLTIDGCLNEGFTGTLLGLRGMPEVAEEIMIARNILLAEKTGSKLHIQHVSTKGGVELIRFFKNKNVKLTAETCPHYFSLTDEALKEYNVNAKMNPPLREEEDVLTLKEGLKDGTIDCIATDHAPHTELEKQVEFSFASFGIVGLETALPLVITNLVKTNVLTLDEAIAKLTINPAKVLSIDKGTLKQGFDADITIFDPDKEITVDVNKFASKGKNSPFDGFKLFGLVYATLIKGEFVYKYEGE